MSDLNLRIAISIHALREEGDAGPAFPRCRPAISIHALREEGDAAKSMWNAQPAEFLSTPSARRATCPGQRQGGRAEFLSTPSARRATFIRRLAGACVKNFYPRPPRGGRRIIYFPLPINLLFLSTPSARRATLCFRVCDSFVSISIHALREEGDLRYPRPPAHQGISIHALREEGDPDYRLQDNDYSKFLSTPSARRATLSSMAKILRMLLFLSTPSARRATSIQGTAHRSHQISIHALREEGDPSARPSAVMERISIHALREEGDREHARHGYDGGAFLSTPSARRATSPPSLVDVASSFLSTPSARRATHCYTM